MSDKRYIIAIDSGTQSIRAVLFDTQGNELAIEQRVFDPYFSLQPGWAEQSTDDYWDKLCIVTNGLMAKITIDKSLIAGVGITTQRGTVIPMDSQGNALRPAIIWLDQRAVTDPPPLGMMGTMLFSAAGLKGAIKYAQKHSIFLWIMRNEPELYKKTHKFVQASGFFVRKLTGEFHDSSGMVTGIWPFEYNKLRWHSLGLAYTPLGIEKGHCVKLFRPDEVLGSITKKASEDTGIPEGLPVVVGAGDKQSELLGAGAIEPDHSRDQLRHGHGHACAYEKIHQRQGNEVLHLACCDSERLGHRDVHPPGILDGDLVQAGVRGQGGP